LKRLTAVAGIGALAVAGAAVPTYASAPGWSDGPSVGAGYTGNHGVILGPNNQKYMCAADGDGLSAAAPSVTWTDMSEAKPVNSLRVATFVGGYYQQLGGTRAYGITDATTLGRIAWVASNAETSDGVRAAAYQIGLIRVAGTFEHSIYQLQEQGKLTDGNGVGTGEVLDNQGHILTNNHVVSTNGTQQSSRVEVRLHDGSIRVAKIVGTDVTSDLAVIKIDPSGLDLKPITFGDSSKVVPGETVVALGSPHNLQDTVTAGVISNTDRAAEAEKDGVYIPMIQTDAPVNHGNSGGPLVNSSGALVGINSQIESEGGGNEGIAYAIPSNYAKRISDEIISKGKATHGYLGANIESAPGQTNEGESRFFPDGVRVTNISSGSPAEKAGLQKGDVIVEADGHRIEQSKTLNGVVRAQAAGATVDMKIKRGSETKNIKVTLGDADNQH